MTSPLEQKIKISGPIVVTANRVDDGAVVYWRAEGRWTTKIGDATLATNVAAARELIDAATADDLRAVGAYIAPVKVARDGAVLPGNLRETIRRDGPTIEVPALSAFAARADVAPEHSA